MVTLMADKLEVKESFFFMPLVSKTTNPIFWRSRHSSLKHDRAVIQRKFGWSKWIIDNYFKSYMDMPRLNIPTRESLGITDDPNDLTDERIEDITRRLREYWGLGAFPIDNVTALLESNGILVTCGHVESEKLDAFSNISEYDASFHVFLGLDKASATRSRFDACHELGHLLMHAHLAEGQITEKMHKLVEGQANRFASAFLMPAASFKSDVWMTSIEAFKVLKRDWKVSVGAIIKRCDDLGLLGEDENLVRRMWINYRREWKAIEQDDLKFEWPRLMKQCVDVLLDAGVKSKTQICYEIPFTKKDIETLMSLPAGYLSEDYGKERSIPKIKNIDWAQSISKGQIVAHDDFERRT
jgi:Zn-dependent peptidase ImmA (M78 family)